MTTLPSTEPVPSTASTPAIDPADLEVALRVLASLSTIDPDDPDFVTVRQATAKMFKSVKIVRRSEKRQAIAEADRGVIAATATGAPTRIDDETIGAQLRLGTSKASAGELLVARPCYICKER
ncbi:MAG TPA: short-chain dehydrogenase, partial [Cryobacterium sp.]|nr:short-chain dehydrogenase [Cryobacterium sp.]